MAGRERKTSSKALLLRVGMDRGTGGVLGPIFPDGTFEYVPIPETAFGPDALTYAALPGRHVPSLASVLPARLAERHPHIDPDFSALTYGDAAPRKRQQLLHLEPGDLLVLYAGFSPRPAEDRPRLFAFGYFKVNGVYHLSSQDLDRRDLDRRFGQTAHFVRQPRDQDFALIEGDPSDSTYFDRAAPLGDGQNRMLRDLTQTGYQGSLLRAVGHWIRTAAAVQFLEAWLKHGVTCLVQPDTRLLLVHLNLQSIDRSGDLVVTEPGLREGDWVVALTKNGGNRVQALARINCVAPSTGGHRGYSSLYWSFTDGGPTLGNGEYSPLTDNNLVDDAALIRRLVSYFARRYRIGLHTTSQFRRSTG